MSTKIIQQLLEKYNFTPAKIRGQNFLIDEEVLDKIIAAGKIAKPDVVVEIGPGFGFLTKKLATKAKKVLALEIDSRMIKPLEEELQEYYKGHPCSYKDDPCSVVDSYKDDPCSMVEIILGDALNFNFIKFQIEPNDYLLIANIPYQITHKIFEKFLLGEFAPKRAVLLMQREVGERILAEESEQNFLSVVLQNAYKIERVVNVSREKFFPVPKVDSMVLSFSFKFSPPIGFARFVHQGFIHSKKKLINNLTTLFAKEQLTKIFNLLGIDLSIRPGKIALEVWLELFNELKIKVK